MLNCFTSPVGGCYVSFTKLSTWSSYFHVSGCRTVFVCYELFSRSVVFPFRSKILLTSATTVAGKERKGERSKDPPNSSASHATQGGVGRRDRRTTGAFLFHPPREKSDCRINQCPRVWQSSVGRSARGTHTTGGQTPLTQWRKVLRGKLLIRKFKSNNNNNNNNNCNCMFRWLHSLWFSLIRQRRC